MDKFIGIVSQGVESSSTSTPQWEMIFREFKKEFLRELKVVKAKKPVFNKGHFYISGFFTKDKQIYYFSISDVRYFGVSKLLIRTAKDYNDFTGGRNNEITIEKNMLMKFFNN